MKKSVQLKQERTQKLNAQKTMIEARNATESKEFTAEERTAFEGHTASIDDLDKRIATAEADERAEARIAGMSGEPVGQSEEREHEKLKVTFSLHKAIRSQMTGGKLDGAELEIHQETAKRAAEAGVEIGGIAIPMPSHRNEQRSEKRWDGQSVTQDGGAYGANLVATEVQSPIEFLRPRPVLESLGARFLTGLKGDLKFPTSDGGITAYWEGEVDPTPLSRNAYGAKGMSPKRLGVSVPISLQNLLQSSFDLEMFTIDDIRLAIAEKIDRAGINGSGTSNEPLGILNVAGTNSEVAGPNGTVPTWAQIVNMESATHIANANAAKMAYLINPGLNGLLKQTVHAANASNYLMNPDGTINGYPVAVSNLVPNNLTKGTSTGNASAGIFGDFSQLLIGQWGFLDISVDDKSHKRNGFIQIDVNTFVDVLVRQPKAFTVIKDWLLA